MEQDDDSSRASARIKSHHRVKSHHHKDKADPLEEDRQMVEDARLDWYIILHTRIDKLYL